MSEHTAVDEKQGMSDADVELGYARRVEDTWDAGSPLRRATVARLWPDLAWYLDDLAYADTDPCRTMVEL